MRCGAAQPRIGLKGVRLPTYDLYTFSPPKSGGPTIGIARKSDTPTPYQKLTPLRCRREAAFAEGGFLAKLTRARQVTLKLCKLRVFPKPAKTP